MTTPPFNPSSDNPGAAADATQPVPDLAAPVYRPGPPPGVPGALGQQAWQAPSSSGQGPASQAGSPPHQPGSSFGPGSSPTSTGSPYAPGVTFEPAPFRPLGPEPAPVLVPPVTGRRSSGSSRLINVALGVAVLVAAAGVSFALGRATAPPAAASTGRFGLGSGAVPNGSFAPGGNGTFRGGNGGFLGRGGAGAGLTIQGTVASVTGDSMTITTTGGQTITIGLDSSTTYHQQAPGSSSDVQTGKTVIIDVTGGFRGGAAEGNGGANGNGGTSSLGTAADVTVVP